MIKTIQSSLFSVLLKPLIIKLVIGGQAKSIMNRNLHGMYHLQDDLVNNYPYWDQIDGNNSLWFGKEYPNKYSKHYQEQTQRRWFLGPREYHGKVTGYIIGPKGIDDPPTRIIKGWKYFDNEWKEATGSEITFLDLSPSELSSFSVI